MKGKKTSEQGQALLITVMLLATALIVALSTSFTSKTETQLTKLEEESQRAFAAAEAGLELTLSQTNQTTGVGFSGIVVSTSTDTAPKTVFVSPLLEMDEQYNFYLADYPSLSNSFSGNNLTVYYGSDASTTSCNDLAVEATLVYFSGSYKVKRWIGDTGNKLKGSGQIGSTSSNTKDGISFKCSMSLPSLSSYPKTKILFVRALYQPTRFGFEGSSSILPKQGTTIVSRAQTISGVTKTIELFQSYPQIPTDFFLTAF